MNDIRDKIWYFWIDSKTNELLASLIVKKYQKWDLFTNIFLVVATSSSVAIWTVWDILPTLWAVIIGISQLLTLIKPYFLFPKYIKVFNEKSIRWQHLVVELEQLLYELDKSLIEENKASNSFFDFKKNSLVFDNVPDDIIFFNHSKEHLQAETSCNIYVKKIYNYE